MVLYENCPVHRSQRYLFHIQIQNSRDFKNGKTRFAMIAYFRFAQRIYHSRKLYVPPDKSTFWRKCIMRAFIKSSKVGTNLRLAKEKCILSIAKNDTA